MRNSLVSTLVRFCSPVLSVVFLPLPHCRWPLSSVIAPAGGRFGGGWHGVVSIPRPCWGGRDREGPGAQTLSVESKGLKWRETKPFRIRDANFLLSRRV